MGKGEPLIYGIFGLVVGLILFVKGFFWLKQKRLIENIPTSKVRSLAMGLVEISGEAKLADKHALKSPFSNKDCVYYKYTVEEYCKQGKSHKWVTRKKGAESVNFYLKDATGAVLVDPKGANIDIPADNEFKSKWGRDPPAVVMNFLKAKNISFEGFFGANKTMRYREYFLAPKDKVYLMGTAGKNPFVKEGTAVNNVDNIMMQKGKNEKFYFISDSGEKHILEKLKWLVILGFFGGGILSVVCLIFILFYLALF
jgi:hypothetical protein